MKQIRKLQTGRGAILCSSLCAVIIFLSSTGDSRGQSSPAQKTNRTGTYINVSSEVSGGPKLPHNGPDAIRKEVLDTNFIALIAKSAGITQEQLAMLELTPGPAKTEIWYALPTSVTSAESSAIERFSERLQHYVRERMNGHTKECLLAGLTNKVGSDINLQWFAANYPLLPSSWARITRDEAVTDSGNTARRKTFELVDGDIAWSYTFDFNSRGMLLETSQVKFDAKEVDPKLKETFATLDKELADEMKQLGISGQLGAVNSYWRLKKEKLKAKGIEWRSPAELNSGIFD